MEKRKNSFNIIDAIIIAIVLAVGAGAYFVFFGEKEAPVEEVIPEVHKVRYVLQVSELPAEYADNVKVGEILIDYSTVKGAGEVVAVDFENHVYVGHDKTTGEQKLTELEDYVDLYITVEGNAVLRGQTYYINDTSLYIGRKIDMMMPDLYCSGYCISFETVE